MYWFYNDVKYPEKKTSTSYTPIYSDIFKSLRISISIGICDSNCVHWFIDVLLQNNIWNMRGIKNTTYRINIVYKI